MSVKARREATREEQVKIAAKEAEKRLKARSEAELKRLEKKTPGVASIINQLNKANNDDAPALMWTGGINWSRRQHGYTILLLNGQPFQRRPRKLAKRFMLERCMKYVLEKAAYPPKVTNFENLKGKLFSKAII